MEATTKRRQYLEKMLDKYAENIKSGQKPSDIIASMNLLTTLYDKYEERNKEQKNKLTLIDASYNETFKRELENIPDNSSMLHSETFKRELENIPETEYFTASHINLNSESESKIDLMLMGAVNMLRKAKDVISLSNDIEAYAIHNDTTMNILSKTFEKIANSLNLFNKLQLSGEALINTKRELSLNSIKESIASLALNVEIKSAYYSPQHDVKKVLDVMKNLNSQNMLPKDVVRAFGTFQNDGTYKFIDDVDFHSSYSTTKGYDLLVKHINKETNSHLKSSKTLLEEKLLNMSLKYNLSNDFELNIEERKLDIVSYALIKTSIALTEMVDRYSNVMKNKEDMKRLNTQDGIMFQENFDKAQNSLTSLEEEISKAMSSINEDISTISKKIELGDILTNIIKLKEDNYDLMINSILEGTTLEGRKEINLSSEQQTNLVLLKDAYNDQVQLIIGQKENIDFIKSLPEQIHNLVDLENKTALKLKEIIESNNFEKKDLNKDIFLKNKLTPPSL